MLTSVYNSFNVLLLHLIQIAIVFFILLVVAVPCVTLLLSWRRKRGERRRKMLHQKYEEVIFPFLYHGNMNHIRDIRKKLGRVDKEVFIGILNDLSRYFTYKDQNKIRQIAAVYDLESYILKNINWILPSRKIRALKILVNIGCTRKSYPILQKLQRSKDVILRFYAIQNLILYGSFGVEQDFPDYKYSLSLWEQMGYFFLFRYKLKEEPHFSALLYSPNVTVILFGLRMMRLFHQSLDITRNYEGVLMSKDAQVQVELYRLLAMNKESVNDSAVINVGFYPLEDMLSNYARLDYVTTDTMLDIYHRTDNLAIKRHILICVYDYVAGGKADIEYFAAHHEDGTLNEMCRNLIMEKNGK
ncbi:MAG: hypothetical protein LKH27_05300 [Prevotella sp.]|jgi:hypothetical protein|nr:hypothetical protein [Prevotella sp.]MCH3985706.1 hypothetical protein [Prevotella sp.]MCH3993259.1 hypothetical protein [Prevotella sp.]MCH4251469.1 hypothetical protein [Prevotella sp.]MCI1291970.1 hypothetical protein [Prevotella sp.]MCI1473805.1 hypothetical protein [Prevotella sp.]